MSTVNIKENVDAALTSVRRVLDTSREPVIASDISHGYDDKYALADFMANMWVDTAWAALLRVGITSEHIATMREWQQHGQAVTLEHETVMECTFLKTRSRTLESHDSTVTVTIIDRLRSRTKNRIVEEFLSNVSTTHKLYIYAGTDRENAIMVSTGTSLAVVVKSTNKMPFSEREMVRHGVDVTWLVKLSGGLNEVSKAQENSKDRTDGNIVKRYARFQIQRTLDSCRTPRRNDDIKKLIDQSRAIKDWCHKVVGACVDTNRNLESASDPISPVAKDMMHDVGQGAKEFVPIFPLLEQVTTRIPPTYEEISNEKGNTANSQGAIASSSFADVTNERELSITPPTVTTEVRGHIFRGEDARALLEEHARTLDEAVKLVQGQAELVVENFCQFYVKDNDKRDNRAVTGFRTSHMMTEIFIFCHMEKCSKALHQGLDFIEDMLNDQLVSALGKHVTSQDFRDYMDFHYNALFAESPHLSPKPFSHAVALPGEYPEGIVMIEMANNNSSGDGNNNDTNKKSQEKDIAVVTNPIQTSVRSLSIQESSKVACQLNAGTTVHFTGPCHVHAHLAHKFSKDSTILSLVARAREFSSFMMLLGNMGPNNSFIMKDAIMLENKDCVTIPLMLDVIPSAKAFKKQVSSLSNEQQRFSKQFRSMQLASSVFGIMLVQIKPQMERVLNLPAGSLTKHLELSNDLKRLFIDYNISPDLVAFDETNDKNSNESSVNIVRGHVSNVKDMLDGISAQVVAEEKQARENEAKAQLLEKESMLSITRRRESITTDSSYGEDSDSDGDFSDEDDEDDEDDEEEECSEECECSDEGMGADFVDVLDRGGKLEKVEDECTPVVEELLKQEVDKGQLQQKEQVQEPLQQQQQQQQKQQQQQQQNQSEMQKVQQRNSISSQQSKQHVDITALPAKLDACLGKLDTRGSVRPTKLVVSPDWSLSQKATILSQLETKTMSEDDKKSTRNKCIDLLDALSRSGSLDIPSSSLHVIIMATHCFDKTVIDTVVKDNENPIESVEKSALLVASIVDPRGQQAMINKHHILSAAERALVEKEYARIEKFQQQNSANVLSSVSPVTGNLTATASTTNVDSLDLLSQDIVSNDSEEEFL